VSAHMSILENLFLVRRLSAWHANIGNRQVKAPKLHVSDAGLLAHVLNADTDRLVHDATLAGAVFETFAVTEIARQCGWSEREPSLLHYRDHDRREVDLVLELGNGDIAAVEVKSGSTVRSKDFGAL